MAKNHRDIHGGIRADQEDFTDITGTIGDRHIFTDQIPIEMRDQRRSGTGHAFQPQRGIPNQHRDVADHAAFHVADERFAALSRREFQDVVGAEVMQELVPVGTSEFEERARGKFAGRRSL